MHKSLFSILVIVLAGALGPQYASLGPQLNMIKAVVEGVDIPGFGKYGPHPIVARIYKNEEFMDVFANWYYEHRMHEFHPDTMNALLDEMAAEIRPYNLEWGAANQAPGIYYCTMETGDFFGVIKLLKVSE